MRTLIASLVLVAAVAGPAAGQTPAPPAAAEQQPEPAIRRWVDLQHVHLSSRFRWVKTTSGRLTSSTLQWQPQVRARVLFDEDKRYSLHVGAFSGSQFVSGWNNTGGGLGEFAGEFNVKQLFLSAKPVDGLELQAGGLYMLRGENTEVTTYDNDAYIVGERLTWTPEGGRLTEVSVTTGHIGDFQTPNVFDRLHRMNEWNYGQLLVAGALREGVAASADYTYQDGLDILRQGVSVELPRQVPVLRGLQFDVYERVSPDTAWGYNAAAELRPFRRLRATVGVTAIDRAYGDLNADRYGDGTRFYSSGSVALTRDLSVGWYHGEAIRNALPVPNEHRFEINVTLNPTASLKRARIF